MTTSANDSLWSPEAWANRLASGNPVFPFEWVVHYRGGARFSRVCQGIVRTSAQAPLMDVDKLRVLRPGAVLDVLAPDPAPDALVIRARVVRPIGAPDRGGVSAWTFGFLHGGEFYGVTLDATGRVTEVRPAILAALHHVRNGRG